MTGESTRTHSNTCTVPCLPAHKWPDLCNHAHTHVDTHHFITCMPQLSLTISLTKKHVVHESVLDHNHHVGPDVSVHYSPNRKLTKPATKTQVHQRNVHNLKTRMKTKSHSGRRDEQLLLEELENNLNADTSSCGSVVKLMKTLWRYFFIGLDTWSSCFKSFQKYF